MLYRLSALMATLLLLASCKKEIYGCTDQTAENYSNAATADDGSCFFAEPAATSVTVTISNWTINGNNYVAGIPWSEITSDVIDNGAVLVYKNSGSNTWSQLPLTIYQSSGYSTTIEVELTVGQVLIYYKNSDLTLPAAPETTEFKLTIIS